MESKISAQELLNVVKDTNRKVTELTKGSKSKDGSDKPYSRICGATVLLLSLVGVALSVTVLFPEIVAMAGLTISGRMIRLIYVGYAVVALAFSSTVRVKGILRLWAVLAAVAPVCILTMLSIA